MLKEFRPGFYSDGQRLLFLPENHASYKTLLVVHPPHISHLSLEQVKPIEYLQAHGFLPVTCALKVTSSRTPGVPLELPEGQNALPEPFPLVHDLPIVSTPIYEVCEGWYQNTDGEILLLQETSHKGFKVFTFSGSNFKETGLFWAPGAAAIHLKAHGYNPVNVAIHLTLQPVIAPTSDTATTSVDVATVKLAAVIDDLVILYDETTKVYSHMRIDDYTSDDDEQEDLYSQAHSWTDFHYWFSLCEYLRTIKS